MEWRLGFMFYVFTYLSTQPTTSGGAIVLFLVFTFLSTNPTPFGDSIFLLVKKDMEERHAKGLQSRPLESGFLYGGSEGRRAGVLRVRLGAIYAI